MDTPQKLLENNRQWAANITEQEPAFFQELAKGQAPNFLWIGCSDSRVPANEIIGLKAGHMFVHRNIANLMPPTDISGLSVLQYAVEVLKVKHIMICGHYGCGGIETVLKDKKLGIIDAWLGGVRLVYHKYETELNTIEDDKLRFDKLCEYNVLEQVNHVCQSTIVQEAWARKQTLLVHGWIYNLKDGLIKDLACSIESPETHDAYFAQR